jgi:hypothetical protein
MIKVAQNSLYGLLHINSVSISRRGWRGTDLRADPVKGWTNSSFGLTSVYEYLVPCNGDDGPDHGADSPEQDKQARSACPGAAATAIMEAGCCMKGSIA